MESDQAEVPAPTELVERTLNSRPERIARSEARRAARRGAAAPASVLIARPSGTGRAAQAATELADARIYTVSRVDALADAAAGGRDDEATQIIEELLRTEQAIWILVDHTEVQAHWQHLADDLARASDRITEGLRAQLHSLHGPSQLGEIRAGLADWIRAWRCFVLIIAPYRQA
jgi:hypothetical protein